MEAFKACNQTNTVKIIVCYIIRWLQCLLVAELNIRIQAGNSSLLIPGKLESHEGHLPECLDSAVQDRNKIKWIIQEPGHTSHWIGQNGRNWSDWPFSLSSFNAKENKKKWKVENLDIKS